MITAAGQLASSGGAELFRWRADSFGFKHSADIDQNRLHGAATRCHAGAPPPVTVSRTALVTWRQASVPAVSPRRAVRASRSIAA